MFFFFLYISNSIGIVLIFIFVCLSFTSYGGQKITNYTEKLCCPHYENISGQCIGKCLLQTKHTGFHYLCYYLCIALIIMHAATILKYHTSDISELS